MKFIYTTLCCFLLAATVHAQELNWGNEIYGQVVDSTGAEVDNSFVFELGAFDAGFTPNAGNIEDWVGAWNVFDATTYRSDDAFTSQVFMEQYSPEYPTTSGVYSSSTHPSASTMSFSGLDAYIWVRKGDIPVEGTEWLLVRASTWEFPAEGGGCCTLPVLEWSTATDLASTSPLWGRQHDTRGPGVGIFDTQTYNQYSPTLQTFTFIPEPSSALMVGLAAMSMLLRRRRPVGLDGC
jgi:hypothetical protein